MTCMLSKSVSGKKAYLCSLDTGGYKIVFGAFTATFLNSDFSKVFIIFKEMV